MNGPTHYGGPGGGADPGQSDSMISSTYAVSRWRQSTTSSGMRSTSRLTAGLGTLSFPARFAGLHLARADPLRRQFCANVVLTMAEVESALDPAAVFAKLCERESRLVPGTQETSRELVRAMEGPGVAGILALQIPTESGLLDGVSVTRILNAEKRTLIAQLTLTALPDSPVDRANIGPAVTTATPAGVAATPEPSWISAAETAGGP